MRSNVIPPGASLGLYGMSFWPPTAADARRQAVNAMVLMDGGNPRARGRQPGVRRRPAAGRHPAGQRQPAGDHRGLPRHVARQPAQGSRAADSGPLADGPRPPGVLLLDGRLRHPQLAGLARTRTCCRDLSQALSAFALATLDLGLAGNVTTFTQSEFNRTTQTNGTGTDHAWGSHQIVLGGAVQGGIYGAMPDFVLGGTRMPTTAASGFRPSARSSSAPRSADGSAPPRASWPGPSRISAISRRVTSASCDRDDRPIRAA